MREVELWTADGHFVAIVDIPPLPDQAMPKVVMWGDRVFRLNLEDTSGPGFERPDGTWALTAGPWRYDECFAVVSLTPSPGRPQKESSGVGPPDKATDLLAAIAQEKGGGFYPVPPVDRTARCTVGEALAPGVPNTEDRGDGQQRGYVILCNEERAKGFVRPVRDSYIHVGAKPRYPTRDLTPEEQELHKDMGYVKYEAYPQPRPNGSSVVGRYWTDKQLRSGCGAKTTMGRELAETYARDPAFYSGTFCCGCGSHFPVGADGEFVWDGTNEKVGT